MSGNNILNVNNKKYLKKSTIKEKIIGFKSKSKALNTTLKYGMSQDFPLQNLSMLVHPSTKYNIVGAWSKISTILMKIGNVVKRHYRVKTEIMSQGRDKMKIKEKAGKRPEAMRGLFSFLAGCGTSRETQTLIGFCNFLYF